MLPGLRESSGIMPAFTLPGDLVAYAAEPREGIGVLAEPLDVVVG
jgi:hypothetical protein